MFVARGSYPDAKRALICENGMTSNDFIERPWYFAYGSNLWIEQMSARTGLIATDDSAPRIAWLPDYRLVFNMRGEDGQVYANLERPGDGVFGVLYRCGPDTLDKLDAYEGGYERRQMLVTDQDGVKLSVIAYIAKADRVVNGRKPSAEYVEKILRGATQHGLPEDYVRHIERLCAAC